MLGAQRCPHESTPASQEPAPAGEGVSLQRDEKTSRPSPSIKGLQTRWFSAHLLSPKSLHLLAEKQAAGSGRPTQKLRAPTRKLRPVTWKVAGDVAVPGQRNSVGSPGGKRDRRERDSSQPAGRLH